jgi:NADH-quinone oxidoreductase subunit E
VRTFKEVSRVLAGFHDGLADEGTGAGTASLVGLRLARENGWEAPSSAQPSAGPATEQATAEEVAPQSDGDAPGRTEVTPASPEATAGTQAAPEATDPTDEAHGASAKEADEVTAPDSAANVGHDDIQDIGMTDPDEAKGDGEEETK